MSPGIQRFFVTVDGKFFPCERVDEESSELCIGDLKNGFDLENAKKILNVAKITEKECRECWCYKMCSQCVAKAWREWKDRSSQSFGNGANNRGKMQKNT